MSEHECTEFHTVQGMPCVTCGKESDPLPWWYLSFAAEEFLGAVVVQAQGLMFAVLSAHALRINPGGEVFGFPLPEEWVVPEEYRNRLLTKADVYAMDEAMGGVFQPRRLGDILDEDTQ